MKEAIYQSDAFRIEFCDDCFIPGHLIIRPQKSVTSLTELDTKALENLGPMLALCHEAVQKTIQPARIYTLSFCELMPQFHMHVFPRSEILGKQFNALHHITENAVNGALFFDWARKICHEKTREYVETQEKILAFFRVARDLLDVALCPLQEISRSARDDGKRLKLTALGERLLHFFIFIIDIYPALVPIIFISATRPFCDIS